MADKPLVAFSTYIPPEIKKKLEAEAKKQDRSAAALARIILTEHFKSG